MKNVNLEDLENGKYKVNVEYYDGNKLISTVESDNWMESGNYKFRSYAKYISTEKIDKAIIKLTDETGTLIQSKNVQFEDTTSTTENTTTDSMNPKEKFIKEYDTNGDNLLDSKEFPYSKYEKINSKEQFGPYPSIQDLIEDYDINLDHKLSVDELKNIKNLNL